MFDLVNKTVLELLQKNNGILQASEIKKFGIDNKVLQRMTESGVIERIGRGLYLDANCMEDEYLVAWYRCKKGVFSHETALFFHGLCDRTPFRLAMTIPSGYNSRILKDTEHYQFFYCKPELHELGIDTAISPYGAQIRIYNKERTICDCIRKRDKLDADLVMTAVKRYMKETGIDYGLLLEYAEIFKVRDKVKQYIEVLT